MVEGKAEDVHCFRARGWRVGRSGGGRDDGGGRGERVDWLRNEREVRAVAGVFHPGVYVWVKI